MNRRLWLSKILGLAVLPMVVCSIRKLRGGEGGGGGGSYYDTWGTWSFNSHSGMYAEMTFLRPVSMTNFGAFNVACGIAGDYGVLLNDSGIYGGGDYGPNTGEAHRNNFATDFNWTAGTSDSVIIDRCVRAFNCGAEKIGLAPGNVADSLAAQYPGKVFTSTSYVGRNIMHVEWEPRSGQ